VGAQLLVFGGHGGRSRYFGDTLRLVARGASPVWETLPTGGAAPSRRSGHTLTRLGGLAYVMGGFTGTEILNDMHCLDLGSLTWSSVRLTGLPLTPLVGHSVEHAPGGALLVIMGGATGEDTLSTLTWCIDTRDGTAMPLASKNQPPARFWHRSALVDGRLFVFGGSGARGAALADMFTADLSALPADSDDLALWFLAGSEPLLGGARARAGRCACVCGGGGGGG
jgi:hypothetical protein